MRALTGSIPARAGNREVRQQGRQRLGSIPATCGGTSQAAYVNRYRYGLSPHVRGNPLQSCILPSSPINPNYT